MTSQLRGAWSRFRSCSAIASRPFSSSSEALASSSDGLVLRSRSTDVFVNLALEDWIDANVELTQRSILLLWRNQPAVVIGRHQNPWSECDVTAMRNAGIPLARRRSGGGTVYHDLGNLNLTFFASKKLYDRQRNMKVVTDALRRLDPQLNVKATERFDIFMNGNLKISGSASRLSRKSSYHHCTLLHSADRSVLSALLRPSCPGIHSNATPSVQSHTTNLTDHAPSLEWEELLDALHQQYNKEFGFSAASTLVDPCDITAFPGIDALSSELRGWAWTFGKTPKFTVETSLELSEPESPSTRCSARLHVDIKSGLIERCVLDVPVSWLPDWIGREMSSVMVGERFCRNGLAVVLSTLLRCEYSDVQRKRLLGLSDAVLSAMG